MLPDLLFLGESLALFGSAAYLLIALRRRASLEPAWYALTFLGACAYVLTLMAKDVLFRLYRGLLVPPDMSVSVFFGSWQGLVFEPVMTGFLLEGLKGVGVYLFHTHFTRTRWPLYAVSIGMGAGLVQAFHLLGALAWGAYLGGTGLPAGAPWLPVHMVGVVALEAAVAPLVLYWWAQDRRVVGWLLGGGVHALALLCLQVLEFVVGVRWPWLTPLVLLAFAGMAAGLLLAMYRRMGWPM
jgi:hypothetical protein